MLIKKGSNTLKTIVRLVFVYLFDYLIMASRNTRTRCERAECLEKKVKVLQSLTFVGCDT
jgi:hypothetical protein